MTAVLFVALAHLEPGGGYRASFPDLPDANVSAPELPALLVAARQALSACLQRLTDAAEAWPKPTPIEGFDLSPGTFPLLVDVAVDDPPVRVNISLGEQLLGRLDAAAETRGMSRSGFIAQAVRVSLGERGPANDFDAATRTLQDELRTLGRKINDSVGPGSAFSRRMAELDEQVYDGVRRAADSVSAAMSRRRAAGRADDGAPAQPSPAD
jgi:predicted RNase H-like HicB family nuclease